MNEVVKKKTGRPKGSGSKYTEDIAATIVARLSEGEPLRHISRDLGIAWLTIYRWMEAHEGFASRIARARELGQEAILEEAMAIADTPLMGIIETIKPDGTIEQRKEDMLGHRKLQIETRLKLLAKWNPKKWGEKITHSGDESQPLVIAISDISKKW